MSWVKKKELFRSFLVGHQIFIWPALRYGSCCRCLRSPFMTLSFIQLGPSALITVVTVAATVGKQFTGRKTAKAHRRGAGSREAAQRESVEQRNSGARLHQEKLSDMKKEYICTCYYSAFQVIKMRPPAGVDYICSASKKKKMCITMTTFNKPTPLLPFSFCGDPPTSTLVPPLHEQTEWVCQL